MIINKVCLSKFVFTFCLVAASYSLCADETTPSPKVTPPCQQAEHYRHFDFWLGQFDVYGKPDKSGPLYGTNTISSSQQGCLLTEEWIGAKGSTGTSVNYYDGVKGLWVQHWVSADGTVINIEGGLTDGSMLLKGHIYYANSKTNPIRKFKGTWTPLKEGVVKQFFEESIDDGKTWTAWFTGYYFPRE